MNIVKCPRRVGAKYMSISETLEETPQEPIPLMFRAYPIPLHGLSVCVGPLYGPEKKWLEITEFIEHYKLMGIRHFYFTIFNMNEYTRKIMDEYIRTGEVELTVIQSEYENVDWQFHLLQINECHQRAKYHSKWVINADIDERLVMLNGTVQDLIRSYDDTVVEISFAVQRTQKTEMLPEVYESDEQIIREMEFLKYNYSAGIVYKASKCMYRPEKIAAMYYHWSYQRYPGFISKYVPRDQAYFQHYRTTSESGIGSGWLERYTNFTEQPTRITFGEELKNNVLRKIKYVYDRRILNCEELPDAVYQEYIIYGHETFHCKFKSELENERRKKISNATKLS
uniref:Glycosyltransferase family 92 protein n=1 Tax=Caenorhabditis tropicalis TaxID=1561998 RepID=A0A1I7V2D8_9PELO